MSDSSDGAAINDNDFETYVGLTSAKTATVNLQGDYGICGIDIFTQNPTGQIISVYGVNKTTQKLICSLLAKDFMTFSIEESTAQAPLDNFSEIIFSTDSPVNISEVKIHTPDDLYKEIELLEFKFVNSDDGTGITITDLNYPTVGAFCTVKNLTDEPKNMVLVFAIYDKNRKLVKINHSADSILAGGEKDFSTGLPTNCVDIVAGVYVKAFFWENLNNINPYLGSRELVHQ